MPFTDASLQIDGDASSSMTFMEMATASEFSIGVKLLILDNEFQGMVQQWRESRHRRSVPCV